MHSYPNARLTKKGRLRLINQHLLHRRPLGRTLHSQRNWRTEELWDQLLHLSQIAWLLGAPFSTVARILNR